jgi:hypothetical protein
VEALGSATPQSYVVEDHYTRYDRWPVPHEEIPMTRLQALLDRLLARLPWRRSCPLPAERDAQR